MRYLIISKIESLFADSYGETAKIVNRLKDNGNSTFSIDFADFGKGMDAAALGNMLSAGCNEEDELKFSKEMEEARLQNFRTVTNITRYGVGFKVAILKLAANTDSWYVASRARGESEYNFYTGPLKFGRVSISTGWKVPQDILDMCDGEYPSTVIHVDCEKAFATTVSKNSRNAKNWMTLANFNLDVVKRNLAEHIDYIYAGYLRETATSKPLTEIWFDDYPMADGTYGKLKAVPYDVPYTSMRQARIKSTLALLTRQRSAPSLTAWSRGLNAFLPRLFASENSV